MAGLTDSQLEYFYMNGYLVIPNELSPCTVAGLVAETRAMLSSFSLAQHPMTKFTTGDSREAHVGNDYFLTSGDKIRFFFEPDAFSAEGELKTGKEKAVNKIGHYLHELSPSFKRVSLSSRNVAIAQSLGFKDTQCLQSMVICKQPEIGGAVPSHQDSTFLYTDPPSAVGFWYALEDATVENGCLSFAPASHKTTPISTRFVRLPDGGTDMTDNATSKFPQGFHGAQHDGAGPLEFVMAPVTAGSLVLIHGNTLHKSEKNTSSKSRLICTCWSS